MFRWTRATLWGLLVIAMVIPSWSEPALAQDTATPPADSTNQLFQADEVDAAILSSATVNPQDISQPRFLLERLDLPLGSSLPEHTAAATELLYIESGTVSIADNFGFTSSASAVDSLHLVEGTTYSLSNDGTEPVSLLRASIAQGQDATTDPSVQNEALATPATDEIATPVFESATPVIAGPTITATSTSLINLPIEALPTGEASFFLAEVSFAPGADSGEQAHAGPIALYIDEGVLGVQSPSGLSGQLNEGQSVSLPESAPLVASNQGNAQTVAYIVGVVEAGDTLMAEVTPAPVPTATPIPTPEPTPTTAPTPTVEPTATIEPTPTPEPTPTIEPTPTPEPTATPTPTPTPSPTPMPAAGTILYEADTSGGLEAFDAGAGWNMVNGMLVSDGSSAAMVYAPFDPNGLANYAVEAEIQVLPTDRHFAFGVSGRATEAGSISLSTGLMSIRAFGFRGSVIQVSDDVIAQQAYDNVDSEWHTYRLEMDGNQIRGLVDGAIVLVAQDNRLLDPGFAGLHVRENTQINVRAFRVIALGGSAGISETTTEAVENANEASSEEAASSSGTDSDATGEMTSLLPLESGVMQGLETSEEGSLSADEITSAFINPAEAVSLFQQWGFQENVFRFFATPNGEPLANGLLRLEVSAHRFGSPDGAAAALDYYANVRRDVLGIVDGYVDPMGDQSRAIGGQTTVGVEVTVYVRRGDVVVRVTAISAWGDPTADAVAVAQYVANAEW